MNDKPIPSLLISHKDYQLLKSQLIQDHGQFIMISWVSRRELGFTFRHHRLRSGQEQIYIDFYDEASRTYFLLKYFNHEN